MLAIKVNVRLKSSTNRQFHTTIGKQPVLVKETKIEDPSLLLVKEISVLGEGKYFHKTMERELGLSAQFCRSSSERTLRINIESGKPDFDPNTNHSRFREVTLYQPIVSYTVFETTQKDVRFICIGCTNKTVYMIVKEDLAYSFVVDMSSLTGKEAVKNLYASNLNKGPILYEKTATLLPSFFDRLFAATFTEPTVLEFKTLHISGVLLPMRLYYHPQKPELNMLSICGWVHDINLNAFPGRQINRAYNAK